jgi:AbrB family looped-hinge helix DNA binding protein
MSWITNSVEKETGLSGMALIKFTRSGQVTLPAEARRRLRLEEGDYMEVYVTEDSIILTPKVLIDKSQSYFWTPEWQAAEHEASADIAEGRVAEFDNIDAMLDSLRATRELEA